jgi:hypothetical protein
MDQGSRMAKDHTISKVCECLTGGIVKQYISYLEMATQTKL